MFHRRQSIDSFLRYWSLARDLLPYRFFFVFVDGLQHVLRLVHRKCAGKKMQYICLSEAEAIKRKDINWLTSKLTSHDSSLSYMRHETRGKSSTKLATFILSGPFFSLSFSFLPRQNRNMRRCSREVFDRCKEI